MPAWRILVCVCFAIGFALSSQAARAAHAESTGEANIRITVSHVPTLANVSVLDTTSSSRPDQPYCVNASVHAAPHRLMSAADSAASIRIVPGAETCIESLPAEGQLNTYRIVPE